MLELSKQSKVGFIGTGVMGKSMAAHLRNGGYDVAVYTRTKERALDLLNMGIDWAESIAELAAISDVIVTMVGYPRDVEEVYLGEQGVLVNAKANALVVDMTTSSPALAVHIYEQAKSRGIYSLDAPVSGGDVGAKNATLSIMAGGDEDVFHAAHELLSLMGANIVYQGAAGAGQHTKMCNQIAIASNMMGVCEAMVYAKRAGLDPETVLKSIGTGAAGSWSLSNLAPRMLAGNFAPGFYIKHFIKDMTIALDSAEAMGLLTPGLKLAKSLYEELAAIGEENSGTQALYKLYTNQVLNK